MLFLYVTSTVHLKVVQQFCHHPYIFEHTKKPFSTKYDGMFVMNSNTKVPCIVTVLNWISFCTRN